jgi:predicted RNA binding protein YcfA (HicA-like mRNA interferase family)
MKLPRDLSGQALVVALCRHWRYRVVHQQGSHLIIQTEEPSHQRLSIPAHADLRIGTLNSILRLSPNIRALIDRKFSTLCNSKIYQLYLDQHLVGA